MKTVRQTKWLAATLLVLFANSALHSQALDRPKQSSGPRPSQQTIEAWQARKFGMFIHFGVYSALGGVWKGKEIKNGYSEQIQSHAPIPKAEYEQVARQFDPEKFDPEAIVKLAQDAGMKFIVITAKHHDGFNMFHTKLTDYNVVDYTPYHRDVVKELSDACARHGMKFGVYYSSIDWHYPGATTWEKDEEDNDNPIPKAHEDFNVGQLKELTSNYGPLSEIWFDMGKPTPAQSKRFADTVHSIQPNCMVSGRVFNYQGDFTVMGDNQVPKFVIDEPWQTPASIYTDTLGYRSWAQRTDLAGKIDEHIFNLAQVVSRGGNYLLNIGPRGDGSVVPFEADVLQGVGHWLRTNGEAVYGTQPQPFRQLSFGYATVKQGRLYLLIRQRPSDGRLQLPGLQTKLQRAYFLSDPKHSALKIDNSDGHTSIVVGKSHETAPVTVVVAEYSGKLSVIPPTNKPDEKGSLVLAGKDADHFLNYNGYGYSDPATIYKEQWAVALEKGGKYKLDLVYEKPEEPRHVDVIVGGHRLSATLDGAKADEQDSSHARTSVGVIELQPSSYFPVEITPPEPFIKGQKLGVKIVKVELTRVN
jgi:alpha-L-fucosidase